MALGFLGYMRRSLTLYHVGESEVRNRSEQVRMINFLLNCVNDPGEFHGILVTIIDDRF